MKVTRTDLHRCYSPISFTVIRNLHAGEAKTDARDAAIIAEAARTLPHALRTLKLADEQ
ncbi:transposase, partial [Escherichia coli]|nr:transposase [Escherichia coli]